MGSERKAPCRIFPPTRCWRFRRGSTATVLRVKAYERLVVEAIRTHDRDTALRALTANPLVGPYVDAETLLAALLGEPGVSP